MAIYLGLYKRSKKRKKKKLIEVVILSDLQEPWKLRIR